MTHMIMAKDRDDPLLQSVTFGAVTGPASMLGTEEKEQCNCQAKQVEEKRIKAESLHLKQVFEEVYRA